MKTAIICVATDRQIEKALTLCQNKKGGGAWRSKNMEGGGCGAVSRRVFRSIGMFSACAR